MATLTRLLIECINDELKNAFNEFIILVILKWIDIQINSQCISCLRPNCVVLYEKQKQNKTKHVWLYFKPKETPQSSGRKPFESMSHAGKGTFCWLADFHLTPAYISGTNHKYSIIFPWEQVENTDWTRRVPTHPLWIRTNKQNNNKKPLFIWTCSKQSHWETHIHAAAASKAVPPVQINGTRRLFWSRGERARITNDYNIMCGR